MGIKTYIQPREKLLKRGIEALSDRELLQLLIGSGNAQASVGKIAKRTLALLKQFGGNSSYAQLKEVSGLGPARISQIMAAFELASRFPINRTSTILDSRTLLQLLLSEGDIRNDKITYVTLDGAKRLIMRRIAEFDEQRQSMLLGLIMESVIADRAAYLIVIRGIDDSQLHPGLADLTVAKGLRQLTGLLGVSLDDYLITNKRDHYSVLQAIEA